MKPSKRAPEGVAPQRVRPPVEKGGDARRSQLTLICERSEQVCLKKLFREISQNLLQFRVMCGKMLSRYTVGEISQVLSLSEARPEAVTGNVSATYSAQIKGTFERVCLFSFSGVLPATHKLLTPHR